MSFVPGIGTVQTCAFHRSDRSNDRGDAISEFTVDLLKYGDRYGS
jgi:hypothetical protein